ncbi:MAG: glycosyltransferase family 2 protein [Pyrinomonadaceae bacterium]
MKTPVALFIFNRPETTSRVFAEISKARPPKLLVIADGPRADPPGEAATCAVTRAIVEKIDWDCEVFTNFSEVNLGCGLRLASGIDWVFQTTEEAVILEDDCLPCPTFFRFCDELLARYRNDERVMMISGNNFQSGHTRPHYSYYFSRYPNTWGWACWRRAWQYFDRDMKLWPTLMDTDWLIDILGDQVAAAHWRQVFSSAITDNVGIWDYQWLFSCWVQNGLSITPGVNLVSNIGFGNSATHTKADVSSIGELPTEEMSFPLRHPPHMLRDRNADGLLFKIYEMQSRGKLPNFLQRLQRLRTGRYS